MVSRISSFIFSRIMLARISGDPAGVEIGAQFGKYGLVVRRQEAGHQFRRVGVSPRAPDLPSRPAAQRPSRRLRCATALAASAIPVHAQNGPRKLLRACRTWSSRAFLVFPTCGSPAAFRAASTKVALSQRGRRHHMGRGLIARPSRTAKSGEQIVSITAAISAAAPAPDLRGGVRHRCAAASVRIGCGAGCFRDLESLPDRLSRGDRSPASLVRRNPDWNRLGGLATEGPDRLWIFSSHG